MSKIIVDTVRQEETFCNANYSFNEAGTRLKITECGSGSTVKVYTNWESLTIVDPYNRCIADEG